MPNKTYSDSSRVFHGYTPAGQLAARTNANGSVSRYFHSPGGKLLREEHPSGTDDVSYEYDAHGNQIVASCGIGGFPL